MIVFVFFFFFKQKTAYEMRISDWSSDVCSSDLQSAAHRSGPGFRALDRSRSARRAGRPAQLVGSAPLPSRQDSLQPTLSARLQPRLSRRSEEHTSELQSLMRRSYAVFCLKKKRTSLEQATTIPNKLMTSSSVTFIKI